MTTVRLPLILALVFAVAYTQPPAFYSNQHQYFLHGLAVAGEGNLKEDWLANTTDPTPVFSAVIAFGHRIGDESFRVGQIAALMVYFLSVWKLVEAVGILPQSRPGQLLFAGLFTLSHAAILRVASDRLLGADYPWFVQCGLANQYLLGAGLQPSVVGVLLVTSLALYASGRPMLACGLAAGVNVIHATYLLPSAMLVAGMIVGEVRAKRKANAVRAGGIALLIAIPVAGFQFIQFGPTESGAFAEAQRIIAEDRIPHHARPARWVDAAAGFQLIWIGIGWVLLRATSLGRPFVVTTLLAALGTAAVLFTDHPTLALLFPWRVSAVLVPVSTAAILAVVAAKVERRADGEPKGRNDYSFRTGIGVGLLLTGVVGAWAVSAFRLGYREPAAEDAVLAYIHGTKKPGEVYLTPARFAKPTTARGVYSLTFAPPTDPNATVYFELARFRLATGAAQYVDFKSIPYRDVEVLEWHRRVFNCVKWFGQGDWDSAGTIDELTKEGITHVVAPAVKPLTSKRLEPLAEPGAYRVYRIK